MDPFVKKIQEILESLHYSIRITGESDDQTRDAVIAFQTANGLVPDGLVGVQTWKALREASTPPDENRRIEPEKSEPMQKKVEILPSSRAGYFDESYKPARTPMMLHTARPIDTLIVHCAATPEFQRFTVHDIRAWHKKRGFSDVGYHYVTYLEEGIWAGRPIGQVGAHVAGHNTGSIGICYIGGVDPSGKYPKDTRTPTQYNDLIWLVRVLTNAFPSIKRIAGHNEFAAKACPSFDVPSDVLGNLPGFYRGMRT